MYDVYDVEKQCYLPQTEVKALAEKFGFNYIYTLYDGEFISWEHCRSFMNEVVYSQTIEEGIVVKNQSKLNDPNSRTPFVLKIVNDKFAEVMKTRVKEIERVETLSLKDFSFETYRQDLIDYLDRNRDEFRRMPNGIFSGFKLPDTLFEQIPESHLYYNELVIDL